MENTKKITVHTINELTRLMENLKEGEFLKIEISYEKEGDSHGDGTDEKSELIE